METPVRNSANSVNSAGAPVVNDGMPGRRPVESAQVDFESVPTIQSLPPTQVEGSTACPGAMPVSLDRSPNDSSHQNASSALPFPSVDSQSGSLESDSGRSLTLAQVLDSVASRYPEIDAAFAELQSADGRVLSAWGSFDSMVSAHSIAQPLGFYQTYRNGAQVKQPLFAGGHVYGSYRIGDGNFEPWFGERETDEGGELKAGFSLPLARDRRIDQRRADVMTTVVRREQLQSDVGSRILQYRRMAAQSYWQWVAAGQAVEIQKQLLQLAEQRVEQIRVRIEEGDLAEIARIDNDRLIAKRRNLLIQARRQRDKTAIKLSIFLRDSTGSPVIVDAGRLPNEFPAAQPISEAQRAADIQRALAERPELAELNAARQAAGIEWQLASNEALPKLDVQGFAGQDLGGQASPKGDKSPFEFQLGLQAEVPLQRRQARGKRQVAEGKMSQIEAKYRFTTDKIRIEVQDAASAVNAAYQQIQQSRENVRLTRESLELGRLAFEEGDIDLIALNIYETAVADARLELLEAQTIYFVYRAAYRAAIQGSPL